MDAAPTGGTGQLPTKRRAANRRWMDATTAPWTGRRRSRLGRTSRTNRGGGMVTTTAARTSHRRGRIGCAARRRGMGAAGAAGESGGEHCRAAGEPGRSAGL
jgi:hypothetical protein